MTCESVRRVGRGEHYRSACQLDRGMVAVITTWIHFIQTVKGNPGLNRKWIKTRSWEHWRIFQWWSFSQGESNSSSCPAPTHNHPARLKAREQFGCSKARPIVLLYTRYSLKCIPKTSSPRQNFDLGNSQGSVLDAQGKTHQQVGKWGRGAISNTLLGLPFSFY